jgi:hypothetical protein
VILDPLVEAFRSHLNAFLTAFCLNDTRYRSVTFECPFALSVNVGDSRVVRNEGVSDGRGGSQRVGLPILASIDG